MFEHIIDVIDSLAKQYKGNFEALYYLDWLLDRVTPNLRKGVSSDDLLIKFASQIESLKAGTVPKIPQNQQCFSLGKNNTFAGLELLSSDWSQQEIKQAIAYLSSKLVCSEAPPIGKVEIKLIAGHEYRYLRWRENGKAKSKYLGRN